MSTDAECYECTRRFRRAEILPFTELFNFIPNEPDPVGVCPRCGGLCLPVMESPDECESASLHKDAVATYDL
jgi:hypothetical protein